MTDASQDGYICHVCHVSAWRRFGSDIHCVR